MLLRYYHEKKRYVNKSQIKFNFIKIPEAAESAEVCGGRRHKAAAADGGDETPDDAATLE